MSPPFKGTINVDIRDSVPDWTPFEPPKAPEGAPSVVYIVLDDVGFSALGCYGGPVDTPNIDRIAAEGVRYTQWHTTALCSPTRSCLLTGRNHTRNSMACITEAAIGFPNASGTIPPENGTLSEILGELGWNTYMVGKWHLCPDDEMNLASTRRNWPTGRGFERWYGFLGAETSQWYPGPGLRQPPRRPAGHAGGGLPPDRGPHRQGDRVHPGREVDRAGEAVLPLLRARRLPRAAPRAEGVDRQVQGPLRHGLRGDARADARPPDGARPRPARHRAAADQPDRHPRDPHRPRRQAVPDAGRHPPVGLAVRRGEGALLPHGRGVRGVPRARRRPARAPAGLPRGVRLPRQHAGRARVRQRRLGGGRAERLGQRDEVRQRHPGHRRGQPAAHRRARRHEDLQPLPQRLGDGLQHAVQDVEALRVQRRHQRPVHHLVAGRHHGPRRDPRAVPPRGRHRPHDPGRAGRRAARGDQGPRAERLRRRQHALRARRRLGAPRPAARSSTRCSAPGRSGTTAGRPSPTTRRSPAGATSTTTSGSCTTPTSTGPSCTTSPPSTPRRSASSSTSGSRRRAPTAPSRSTTARPSRS